MLRSLYLLVSCVIFTVSSTTYNTNSGILPGVINFHVICHSHDDVGWLKTPEQYYQGSKDIGILPSLYYANGGVQFTLESVTSALLRNPDRKFVVVEQYFFRKWYMSLSPYNQQQVQTLVQNKQLEFANGGMSMPDEANPSYLEMLDTATAGNAWIVNTFGAAAAPKVTSQLDPFGHSSTLGAYFASPLSGFSAVFFSRMDYEEAGIRKTNKTLDFAWQPSPSLGNQGTTLGIYGGQDGYSTPSGLCFDSSIECYPFTDPVNDDPDPDGEDNNVFDYVVTVLEVAKRYSGTYPALPDGTMHIPVMFGDDFQYENAHMNYHSIDRLIHYVNLNTSIHGVNLLYSTPATYANARLTNAPPLRLRIGDIFPYADGPHSVWSGYFTSRPSLKGYVRESAAVFQMAKQAQAFATVNNNVIDHISTSNPLWLLETAVGVLSHHDAVAGTSKQAVAFDYAKRVAIARTAADQALNTWFNTLIGNGTSNTPNLVWLSCDLQNATICPSIETASISGQSLGLLFYNPQSHTRNNVPVRIPIGIVPNNNVSSWKVFLSDGKTAIVAQLLPLSAEDSYLRETYYGSSTTPGGNPTGSMMWLAFIISVIPPMGYTTVYLEPASSMNDTPFTVLSTIEHIQLSSATNNPLTFSNGAVTLTFDSTSGLLSSYSSTYLNGGAIIPLNQSLYYYVSSKGDAADGQCSGAYIFRVMDNTTTVPITLSNATVPQQVNLTFITGPIVNEARQIFSTWAAQVIRLWNNNSIPESFEIEWTVGPIPTSDDNGKEVISRFSIPGWDTQSQWATDSNVREMQIRTRNSRPQYPLTITEFVAQNYVPVNSAIRMTDSNSNVALLVVTDRSQGGASLYDGSIELMIHRRLTRDDGRGVMETLTEPGVNNEGLISRGKHTIVLSTVNTLPSLHKQMQQNSLLPVFNRIGTFPNTVSPTQWMTGRSVTFSGLQAALPPSIELITLHLWNASTVLIRLTHLYELNEDPVLSQNVTISLTTLFTSSNFPSITNVIEMSLVANIPLADITPVTYIINDENNNNTFTLPILPTPPVSPDYTITIAPMEIRTFLLSI